MPVSCVQHDDFGDNNDDVTYEENMMKSQRGIGIITKHYLIKTRNRFSATILSQEAATNQAIY